MDEAVVITIPCQGVLIINFSHPLLIVLAYDFYWDSSEENRVDMLTSWKGSPED